MSESKEFQGKNLDEAIEAACRHYDLKRDKLEIEIVSGGSSGIFGLVGVKKAVVRAKPRGSFKPLAHQEPEAAPAQERTERQERRPERQERSERPERQERQERQPRREAEPASEPAAPQPKPVEAPEGQPAAGEAQEPQGDQPRRSERGRRSRGRGRGERASEKIAERAAAEKAGEKAAEKPAEAQIERAPRRRERPRREADQRPPRREAQIERGGDDEDSGAPQGIGHLDQAKLEEVAREVTQKLLAPLVENAQVSISLLSDRVSVRIEDPDNSGLLIGREGQTLASIQYLVNRLVSKRMDASVRVQIDAGDYRENQDERLRQIARHLADKAMSTGRTQSTRPMSSYHRRVVHLTLQDDEHVFTRSKGEGSMKRVLIMSKRKGKNGELIEDAGPVDAPDYNESAGE